MDACPGNDLRVTVVRLGVAASAAVTWALGSVLGSHSAGVRPTVTPFGGHAAVRMQHVGRIEVDVEAARPGGLRRVACLGVLVGTRACFVAAEGAGVVRQRDR